MVKHLRATPGIFKLIIIHGLLMLVLMWVAFPRDALVVMASYILTFYYALAFRRIYLRWRKPKNRSIPTVY